MSVVRKLSNLNRLRQITSAFAVHGFSGLIDQLGLSDSSLASVKTGGGRVSARFGRRLALALSDLGPTFIKLGQLLATREDILPASVTSELATLQENVAPLKDKQVKKQIAEELGANVDELFKRFSMAPLAAASIAQVHRAKLYDGRDVVVKVQRPGIERTVEDDLALLETLAEMLENRVAEAKRYDPVGLVREFSASLRTELDFGEEANALLEMRKAVGNTAYIPALVEELSARRVLTMELIDGRRVTRVKVKAQRSALAHHLVATFSRQYLRAGYFHADPHPGNLFAEKGSDRLVLLDLGAVGRIDRQARAGLFKVASAAAQRDGHKLAAGLLAMAEVTEEVDQDAYVADVGKFLDDLLSKPLREVPLGDMIGEMYEITRRYALRIKPSYFLLIRSSVILDGVLRDLDPKLDPIAAARPHILSATVMSGSLLPAAGLATGIAKRRWKTQASFKWWVLGGALALGGAVASLALWLSS